ncbi:hypothetical protein Tco_0594749 [Tanacetum coccineum]
MKKVIKEQVKSEVSKITPKIKKLVNEHLESEVLVRSSKEAKTSHAVAANLLELELKKILIDKMEANKSISKSDIQRPGGSKERKSGKDPRIIPSAPKRKRNNHDSGKTTTGSKDSKAIASPISPVEETSNLQMSLKHCTTDGNPDEPTSNKHGRLFKDDGGVPDSS